jgi:hypothetical protein
VVSIMGRPYSVLQVEREHQEQVWAQHKDLGTKQTDRQGQHLMGPCPSALSACECI